MTALTVPQLLERFPGLGDRPLLVTPTERLTYAEAEARSSELARRLLGAGVGKGTRIAIVLANSEDWVVTFGALARIGAHAILLNPFSKAPELDHALRHSDAHAVVTGTATGGASAVELLERAVPALADHQAAGALDHPLCTPTHPFLRHVWWLGSGRPRWAADPHGREPVDEDLLGAVQAQVFPSDPMITSYTSGTTAEPKAVVHSQGAVLRQAHKTAERRRFTPDDVIYTPMPLFWIGGLCFALLSATTVGAPLLTDARFDAGRALDLIEREGATAVYCWPQAAEAMTTHPSFPERDLHRIRHAPSALRGPELAGIALDQREQSLGMTETCGPHTYPLDADVILPESLRGSFGPPMERMEHRIVDPERGMIMPDGEIGELLVRGECLMLGFHKREREDTFDVDGWYRTGDLCSWREGRLFFHGRGGDMIKTAGFNVAPAEVERAIATVDDVLHVAVIGLPDPTREQVIGALVARRPGASVTADGLREVVAERLSSYKVPVVWCVVEGDEYPMGVTGKVDRARARALLEAVRG
ncbi:MAG: AMP-binding protein [Acidimicrobiia bacterium]